MNSVPLQLQASATLCLLGSTFPVIPYPQLYVCWVVCLAYTSCCLPSLFHYSILERGADWSDSSFITRVWRHSLDRQMLVRSTWNQHWHVSRWKDISKFTWHNFMYDASDGVIAGAKGWGGWRHIEYEQLRMTHFFFLKESYFMPYRSGCGWGRHCD